ncbi:MAG: hypothetical protein A3F12_06170 [Gammaproteobacteria bacterium RIFCSPHIGHO2_12_FULL_38_14]|nr:MAG: hypothetical protein A3F12_06170 [Gammaproteobacteria bacterium RIFCSPHIGHO2_12_FULL_38_14]
MNTQKPPSSSLTQEQEDRLIRQTVHLIGFLSEPERSDCINILIGDVLQHLTDKQKIPFDEENKTYLIKKVLVEMEATRTPLIGDIYYPKPSHKPGYPLVSTASEERVYNALYRVHVSVMDAIDSKEASNMSTDRLVVYLSPIISRVLDESHIQLNHLEQTLLQSMLLDEITGLGPLEPLLADESVTDILVNAPNRIYIERAGKLQLSSVRFRDSGHLLNVISRIVTKIGRRIDETTPYVDARLKDGSRVNAIIPPLALDSPILSIRKFNKQSITLGKMVSQNNLSAAMAILLTIAVKCRLNIIISGGTGSGKTTLLNAMSRAIPHNERIITIEDSAELKLQQDHVVRLETRAPNIEGLGAVAERDLVKNALRMRPDRIIVGEVRGAEAFDMLQAMNTGHDGSMCTIHANKPMEVPTRLINMVTMANVGMSTESIANQIASSIMVIVQINRMPDGKRRIVAISEIEEIEGGGLKLRNMFEFKYTMKEGTNDIIGDFEPVTDKPIFLPRAAQFGLDKALMEIF